MKESLPLFYFKPTICWIDDDQMFLEAVKFNFREKYNCLSFNDPREAVEFLQSYESPLSNISLKKEFTESDLYGANDHYPVDIDIPNIKSIINKADKSSEIAVLITDYYMPELNGLEVCKQLGSSPIKKILLTGEASHEEAIEAFNQGLIDKFVQKDLDVSIKLEDYIEDLINQYFYNKTSDIISHIEASRPSLLTDNTFINFFNTWRKEHSIVEFCLVNKQGSFLVIDNLGKAVYFVAQSMSDKSEFLRLNDEIFENYNELFHEVSEGKKIPFFGVGIESWDVEPDKWVDHFYTSQVISGRENYYWAVVNCK
ncbi:MAG: response regulator [Tatlockia sp.]|nr:response regulator [Tatlockia sp.]